METDAATLSIAIVQALPLHATIGGNIGCYKFWNNPGLWPEMVIGAIFPRNGRLYCTNRSLGNVPPCVARHPPCQDTSIV